MLRSLHMKLVMIMMLLILSLMMVVGAFLINSVTAFYLEDFYTQMAEVFRDPDLAADLTTGTGGEEDSAAMIVQVLNAYAGELGVNGRSRKLYILDGNGECLWGNEGDTAPLRYTPNLTFALTTGLKTGEAGDESSLAEDYMDVAIPIQRDGEDYIIYILDNRTTATSLTDQLVVLIIEALIFGLLISVALSLLLSKTMVTPIQRLTEGTLRVAEGDFSEKIEVASHDEIGVLTDTFNDMASQLKRTLRQVENERNKLDTLFLHMTDGVVAFSQQGTMIHANPAARQLLSARIDEETTYDALFGDVAPIGQVLEAPDHLEQERQVGENYLQLLLAPFDQGREAGGVLAVIHDVTQQRKNEEMRREFVANVSHELRTPLTNIRSYAETLADGAGELPPAMEKKFLGVILNESDRMTHIVQDLLTLSRFDSGRDDMKLSRFSFDAAVHDLYNAVYMEAQRHDHTIKLVADEVLPDVVADRERIMQVMMNIVSNSIKYTPDGGEILIKAGRTEKTVWMVVDDNGIGIPEADRPRIFERFYRVDKARSRQSGGTGLGLSIAREIVERHKGVLKLEDKDTPGLAVRLELWIEGPEHG